MSTPKDDPDSELLSFADILEDEFVKLNPQQEAPKYAPEATEEERLNAIYQSIHDLPAERSALCLSGGGIRSATFCLGVLQGLARCGLLGKFHYLSTVSGGGYIGSWLTAWIHRDGAENVVKALRDKPASKINPEPPPISHLRSYSNYLSPKIGAFSVDTWTLVAIYMRNLVLNWLVFIPLLLAVLTIPRLYIWALRQCPPDVAGCQNILTRDVMHFLSWAFVGIGLGLGSMALAYIASNRPSLRRSRLEAGVETARQPAVPSNPKQHPDPVPTYSTDPENNVGNFLRWCMIPLLCAVLLLTIGRAWHLNLNPDGFGRLQTYLAFGALLHTLAWVIYARHLEGWGPRFRELWVVLFTGLLGGAFLWLLLIPARSRQIHYRLPYQNPELYASFDAPLLMMVFLLMGIISIGVGSHSIDDEDREWWARAGAWVLLTIVGWSLFNSLVVWGPHLLLSLRLDSATLNSKLTKAALFVGLISGAITILFGLSSRTPATVQQVEQTGRIALAMNLAVKMAAPLFALLLVVLLALLGDQLINLIHYVPQIAAKALPSWPDYPMIDHLAILRTASFRLLFSFFVAMVVIGCFMAHRININEFSLHSMYRNRLIRAYLGASNLRDAQPFTGFDRNDDLTMADLWPNSRSDSADPVPSATPTDGATPATPPARPPFHILNMTWNLVGGKNLAWQNRKAVSFTVSPLHCGNARYGYRSTKTYGAMHDPLSLGTALTVSGAAASPNMGYHSSPAITFLMTLFNARLGWWLGNPRHKTDFRRSSPKLSVEPMFEEAFGLTDEDKRYIYLSDGGHFENLGLYEMVRRRCHYIFVVDATRDPDYKFENLGNAIRTIRVDLGVPIEIEKIYMYPRKLSKPNAYCALGRIVYTAVGESLDGLLVYIKPTINEGEPTDVYNYAQDRDFPHESTSDQWFSEQQFESYRMLGLHAIEQIFPAGWKEKDFQNLKPRIEQFLDPFKLKREEPPHGPPHPKSESSERGLWYWFV